MKPWLIALIVILAIIVLIIMWGIKVFNTLVHTRNKVKEAFSTMDVYLKKRWDMIPNLVETVKGAAKHEKETLAEVTKLRNTNYSDLSPEEKIEANKKLSGSISKLLAVAEQYPDLKANQNFLNLSESLTKVEEDIANSRTYYNGCVLKMNNLVEMFPTSIIAKMKNFKQEPLFTVDESERQNVQVKF